MKNNYVSNNEVEKQIVSASGERNKEETYFMDLEKKYNEKMNQLKQIKD